jgi:hypothetical protein
MISIVLLLVILCAKIANNPETKKKNGRKSTISVNRSKILVKTTTVSEFGVNRFRQKENVPGIGTFMDFVP